MHTVVEIDFLPNDAIPKQACGAREDHIVLEIGNTRRWLLSSVRYSIATCDSMIEDPMPQPLRFDLISRPRKEILGGTFVITEGRKTHREKFTPLLGVDHVIPPRPEECLIFIGRILDVEETVTLFLKPHTSEAIRTVCTIIAVPQIVRVPTISREENVVATTNSDATENRL